MSEAGALARATLTLGRWLGPWAGAAAPPGIARREVGALTVWERPGRPATGTVLVFPGLHHDGPDDPRFDRFARVLAAAGARVYGASVADLRALRLTPAALADARAACDAVAAEVGEPLAVMSISFASRLALHVAATRPDAVRRVLLFGGYRSWQETFRFALGDVLPGAGAGRDPLNAPVVMGHLLEELLPEAERAPYLEAMRAFCRRTWSRASDPPGARKDDGRHLRVGAELARALEGRAPAAAALLRVACRLEGDALAVAREAAGRAEERLSFLDCGADLRAARAPVVAIHGRDDDVIPWTHAPAIARDAARGEARVTGLYGHTGAAEAGATVGIDDRAREVATLVKVIAAFARAVVGEPRGQNEEG